MTSYVKCFAGTGGIPWACAMLSPAACAPFGCVRVGPDTCAAGGIAKIKTNTSGYYYEHRHMLGFSLGRLSGTGARDYGMFRVSPCVKGKKVNALPGLPLIPARVTGSATSTISTHPISLLMRADRI